MEEPSRSPSWSSFPKGRPGIFARGKILWKDIESISLLQFGLGEWDLILCPCQSLWWSHDVVISSLLSMHQCAPPAFGDSVTQKMSRKTKNLKAEMQISCYPPHSSSVEQEHLPLCKRTNWTSPKHFPEWSSCRGCSIFRYLNVFLLAQAP